ncbi:rhodanese-like domain-containing protein [Pontiella sp.]|uniref:rhodanese-like domain-containing protein n=1 Tax=Pontiella sp. TaxID=2837462 RepID=UPI0035684956
MKTIGKIGLAVITMGLLANLLLRGGADKDADIPQLIQDGALVVDTRTAGEFNGGHIEGAINIPYDRITNGIGQHTTDKAKEIVVYCHSGSRSGSAKAALLSAGYTNVVNGGSLSRMRSVLAK